MGYCKNMAEHSSSIRGEGCANIYSIMHCKKPHDYITDSKELQVSLNLKVRPTSTSGYQQSRDRRRPRPRWFSFCTSVAANGGACAFKSCYPVVLCAKSPSLLCGGRNKEKGKTITQIHRGNVVQHRFQRRKGGLVQRWGA